MVVVVVDLVREVEDLDAGLVALELVDVRLRHLREVAEGDRVDLDADAAEDVGERHRLLDVAHPVGVHRHQQLRRVGLVPPPAHERAE